MEQMTLSKKMQQLITSNTFEEIMELSYDILKNPALIIDMNHNILAYTQAEVHNKSWKKIVLDREMSRNFIDNDIHLRAEHAAAFRSDQALLIEKSLNGETHIKKALVCNGKKLGMLMVVPDTTPLTEQTREYADLIGNILAWKMLTHEGLLFQKDAQKNTFFSSLLDGKQYTEEQIRLWLTTMKISLKKYLHISVCQAQQYSEIPLLPAVFSPVLDLEAFSAYCFGTAFLYENALVLLSSFDQPLTHPQAELSQLEKYLSQNRMSMGISTYFEQLTDIRQFYTQAYRALQLGRILSPNTVIHAFDHLILYDIIQQLPYSILPAYIHPDIKKLAEHDHKNHTSLCHTLLTYLNFSNSLTQTADALFIHKNTVNYRIRQCGDILHTSFKDGRKNFIYMFSLSILQYLQKKDSLPGQIP